jgi:hypothetical protein
VPEKNIELYIVESKKLNGVLKYLKIGREKAIPPANKVSLE